MLTSAVAFFGYVYPSSSVLVMLLVGASTAAINARCSFASWICYSNVKGGKFFWILVSSLKYCCNSHLSSAFCSGDRCFGGLACHHSSAQTLITGTVTNKRTSTTTAIGTTVLFIMLFIASSY